MKKFVVDDMPFDEYLKVDSLSQSRLKSLLESPWKFHLGVKFEDTAAMRLGRIVHCKLLEPEKFNTCYLIKPKITRRGSAWKDYLEECDAGGFEDIVFSEELLVVEEIARTARESLSYAGLDGLFNFDSGYRETSLFWNEEAFSVGMKARLDFLSFDGRVIVDVKTTSKDVNSDKLKWHIRDLGYHTQAYCYTRAVKEVFGADVVDYIFCFINTKSPYLTRFFKLNPMTIEHEGGFQYARALELYKKCKSLDYWPVAAGVERGDIEEIE